MHLNLHEKSWFPFYDVFLFISLSGNLSRQKTNCYIRCLIVPEKKLKNKGLLMAFLLLSSRKDYNHKKTLEGGS